MYEYDSAMHCYAFCSVQLITFKKKYIKIKKNMFSSTKAKFTRKNIISQLTATQWIFVAYTVHNSRAIYDRSFLVRIYK